MKFYLVALLAFSLNSSSLGLEGTSWIQSDGDSGDSAAKCPVVLLFEQDSYKYANECYGKGPNKIVEWGTYDFVDSSLWLEDRRVLVGGHSIFGEDAANMALQSISVSGTIMTFRIGDQAFRFNKKL